MKYILTYIMGYGAAGGMPSTKMTSRIIVAPTWIFQKNGVSQEREKMWPNATEFDNFQVIFPKMIKTWQFHWN